MEFQLYYCTPSSFIIYWKAFEHVLKGVCVPCPSSVSSDRMGCRSLSPAVLLVSDWSSRHSSSAWRDLVVFHPRKTTKDPYVFISMSLYIRQKYNNDSGWSCIERATLMFWASTLALASSSRLMTVVFPASTAQCSAVFLWYLSPRLTETLKVSSSRVGSTLQNRGIISSQAEMD